MLDQNTDRMCFEIGGVIVGAAIIFIANGTLPTLFASVSDTFGESASKGTDVVEEIVPNTSANLIDPENIHRNMNIDTTGRRYPNTTNLWNSFYGPIAVQGGQTYEFSASGPMASQRVAFYDKDDKFISTARGVTGDNFAIAEAPVDAAFAYVVAGDNTLPTTNEWRDRVVPMEEWSFKKVSAQALKIDKQTVQLHNLIINPSFKNNAEGWKGAGSVLEVVDDGLKITGTGDRWSPFARGYTGIETNSIQNNILYVSSHMKSLDGDASLLRMFHSALDNGNAMTMHFPTVRDPEANEWQHLSYVQSIPANKTGEYTFLAQGGYGDIGYYQDEKSEGKALVVKEPLIINLTKAFGYGKEPTKTQMDDFIKEHGWFEGVAKFDVGG